MLAVLHGLAVQLQTLPSIQNTTTSDRWPALTRAARRCGATWAGLLDEVGPAVRHIGELCRAAAFAPEQVVLSHGDVDQKNMIMTGGPVLCDWDLVPPVVPRRELADVALSMGCWRDSQVARLVVRAYRAAGGDDDQRDAGVLNPALRAVTRRRG